MADPFDAEPTGPDAVLDVSSTNDLLAAPPVTRPSRANGLLPTVTPSPGPGPVRPRTSSSARPVPLRRRGRPVMDAIAFPLLISVVVGSTCVRVVGVATVARAKPSRFTAARGRSPSQRPVFTRSTCHPTPPARQAESALSVAGWWEGERLLAGERIRAPCPALPGVEGDARRGRIDTAGPRNAMPWPVRRPPVPVSAFFQVRVSRPSDGTPILVLDRSAVGLCGPVPRRSGHPIPGPFSARLAHPRSDPR